MSIIESSATELVRHLREGQISAVELTRHYLDQIENRNGSIGAFLRFDSESAIAQAEQVDSKRKRGEPVGLLAGVPVAIKDVLCSQGETTTCGSKMLENFVPPYDATSIAKLKAADAVLIGRTNMDEFAMGSSTENSAYQTTQNPWDLQRIPGGSSGGAAACVAASMVPLSIGTDTGGSIRQPAALCGVVGLKPTYGRVSRFGLVAFASSLDQIGPLAHTVEDAALLLQAIAGPDDRDSTCADEPVPNYCESVGKPLEGLRIGIPREHFGEGLDSDIESSVKEAIKVYQSLGATISDVSLPHSKYGIATYYIIAPFEASGNLARFDGAHYGYRCDEKKMLEGLAQEVKEQGEENVDTPLDRMYRQSRTEGFGAEVKRRIMLGTYALSSGYYDAYYLKALKVRRLIRQDYDEAFKSVDVLLGPTTPSAAFKQGEKSSDPLAMYLADIYTVTTNLAGLPGISIPCGLTSQGLPIGLQLQAPVFAEERLLRAAHMFQTATDWHTRRPQA